MRISTAPTPFDAVPKEDRIAWLEMAPTQALISALDQRIKELSTHMCRDIDLHACDEEVGNTYRALRLTLDTFVQLRDWLKSAEVPRGA